MENNTLKEFTSQLLPGIAISFCWDLIKHIFNVLWQKITIAFTTNALVIFLIILALTIIIEYIILNIKRTRLR